MTEIDSAAKRLDQAVARLEIAIKSRAAPAGKPPPGAQANIAALGRKLDATIARLKTMLGD